MQALDFDKNRVGGLAEEEGTLGAPLGDHLGDHSGHPSGASSPHGLLRDSESLLSNVVEGIIDKDREKMRRQVRRYASYGSSMLCW